MRLSSLFAAGSFIASVFVEAAPMAGSSAANIIKRNDLGNNVIDFEFVVNAVRDMNQRYASKKTKSLQKRDDSEFIDQLMVEFHNHNLLEEFLHQLSETPRLKESVEKGVLSAISQGKADTTVLISSLKGSGQLSTFIDSVLNDEDLNDELYETARSVLQENDQNNGVTKRQVIADSVSLLTSLYYEPQKGDIYYDDLVISKYGVSKRDLISAVISIVEEIYDSGLVQDIIHSIIGNQSLVSYAIGLVEKIFTSINWSSVFTAIKNSGIIKTLFASVLSFLSSLFSGNSLSSLIQELFGGNSNSTHKSFLATLLGVGVEIGSDLFKSFTSSSTNGSSSNTGTNGGGLLSTLLNSLFNSTSSPSTTNGGTSSSGTSTSGGFLSSLLSAIFGGSSSPTSSGSSTGSPTSIGNSPSSTSSGGLLSSIFNDIFGDGSSNPGTSTPKGSSSGSSSSGSPSLISSIIDGLFGGNSSGSGSGSGSSSPTKTSSAVSPVSSSGVFNSKKACCCSSMKIKKRALKRALRKKINRSVKRTFSAKRAEIPEGLMSLFYIK